MTGRGTTSEESVQQVLADQEWDGARMVHCRQQIHEPTHWGVEPGERSEHTLIVHLDGRIRRLHTRIEGFGDEHRPALPGDVWCVPAGYGYAARAHGHRVRFVELTLDARAASGDARDLTPRLAHRDEFLQRSIELLLRVSDSAAPHERDIARHLREVITLHVEAAYQRPDPHTEVRTPVLSRAATRVVEDHVHAHLSEPIRVADLAAATGLSVRQFRTRFAATFGTTPADHVLQQRVDTARRLLVETDTDIGAIAHEVGFASHSHLTETFRRRLGVSPRALRASVRGSVVPR